MTDSEMSLTTDFVRPQMETSRTMQEHTSSRLFTDLLTHHAELFPALVEKAHKTLDRPLPQRKATRPVDQRIKRSKLSVSGEDGRELLRGQVPRTPSRTGTPMGHEKSATPRARAYSNGRESLQSVTTLQSSAHPTSDSPTNSFETTKVTNESIQDSGVDEKNTGSAVPEPVVSPPPESSIDVGLETPHVTEPQTTVEPASVKDSEKVASANDDVVLSLDGAADKNNSHTTGARIQRKRPVSKEIEKNGDEHSGLERVASDETKATTGLTSTRRERGLSIKETTEDKPANEAETKTRAAGGVRGPRRECDFYTSLKQVRN